MNPSSDDLEEFHDRVKVIDGSLAKLGNAEAGKELVSQLAGLAREWLRVSVELRNTADGFLPALDHYDLGMTEVLNATKQRSRATAYRQRLRLFVDGFVDKIVVPLMRFEGSPSQAAARQLEALFVGSVSDEEMIYVREAAKCSSIHCHRAAIIMLWAAGVAHLHNKVQAVGFGAFNQAAANIASKKGQPYSRVTKPLAINSIAELQRTRDADILLVGLELWTYDLQAFEEQDRLLGIRNSAAHPGMFSPVALDVRVFAEKLRRYVFDLVK